MEIKIGGKTQFENLLIKNNYSIRPCWIRSDYNQLALRACWLFYHFISNSGSWNNCYIAQYTSVGRALHRYCRSHGFESRSGLSFSQALILFNNCVSCVCNCDDQSCLQILTVTKTIQGNKLEVFCFYDIMCRDK